MNQKLNPPLGELIEDYMKQHPFALTLLKVFVVLEIIFITIIWIFQISMIPY